MSEKKAKRYVDNIVVHLDDITPEMLGGVMDKLFKAGALDVTFTNIQMKKNRPGFRLDVICEKKDTDRLAELIFKETTTTGLRISEAEYRCLDEKIVKVEMLDGIVRVKLALDGGEALNVHPEYEDCRALADKTGRPLKEIFRIAAEKACKEL